MIEIPGNQGNDRGTTGAPGGGRPRHDEGTNFLAWLRENKVLAVIVMVVVLGLGAYLLFGQGGKEDPTGRGGTAVDSGEVGYGEGPGESLGADPSTDADPEAGDSTDGAVSPGGEDGSQGGEAGPEPTEDDGPSESPSPSVEEPPGGYQMDPGVQDPAPVAEGFAAGWLNPEGGKQAWLDRLEPNVTTYALDGLSATAEEAIMDMEVSNVVMPLLEPGEYEMPFRVFGDEGEAVMDGTMIQMPDGSWKVDRILEANTLVW
ncbi:hypothetical protein LG293_16455 (plasmid) [Citricoccus nitrophenolicus]